MLNLIADCGARPVWYGTEENPYIVNDDNGERAYLIGLCPGCGYWVTFFKVYACSMIEALTLTAEFCCDNNMNGFIVSRERVDEEIDLWLLEYAKSNGLPEDLSELRNRDDYWEIWDKVTEQNYMHEWVLETDNPDLFLYADNLRVQEI